MGWLTWVALAVAGTSEDGGFDVRAEGVVPASAEAVSAAVADLARMRGLVPPDCIGRWQLGHRTEGEGATAEVRYDIALLHRALPLVVAKVVPGRYVDWDHPGPRGFVTRWTLTRVDPFSGRPEVNGAATHVRVESFFAPPPLMVQGYFRRVIRPEWETCQARTVQALARALADAT